MDLLIMNDEFNVKLSDQDILTVDFDESSPSIRSNTLSFKGRNGNLNFQADYDEKKLKWTGYLSASNQSDYENKRNWLYQVLGSSNAYYITPMYSDSSQYQFERPGQSSGNVHGQVEEIESKKRFLVILENVISPEFIGNVDNKQIYKLEINFVTAELPFGESKPKSTVVTDSIEYKGTVKASQLEVPFYIVLTAKQVASGISLTVGTRIWTYSGTVANGDVFKIGGVYNLKNLISVNDNTNFEFFVLDPSPTGVVNVSCSINAQIEIHDYKELYL